MILDYHSHPLWPMTLAVESTTSCHNMLAAELAYTDHSLDYIPNETYRAIKHLPRLHSVPINLHKLNSRYLLDYKTLKWLLSAEFNLHVSTKIIGAEKKS